MYPFSFLKFNTCVVIFVKRNFIGRIVVGHDDNFIGIGPTTSTTAAFFVLDGLVGPCHNRCLPSSGTVRTSWTAVSWTVSWTVSSSVAAATTLRQFLTNALGGGRGIGVRGVRSGHNHGCVEFVPSIRETFPQRVIQRALQFVHRHGLAEPKKTNKSKPKPNQTIQTKQEHSENTICNQPPNKKNTATNTTTTTTHGIGNALNLFRVPVPASLFQHVKAGVFLVHGVFPPQALQFLLFFLPLQAGSMGRPQPFHRLRKGRTSRGVSTCESAVRVQ